MSLQGIDVTIKPTTITFDYNTSKLIELTTQSLLAFFFIFKQE